MLRFLDGLDQDRCETKQGGTSSHNDRFSIMMHICSTLFARFYSIHRETFVATCDGTRGRRLLSRWNYHFLCTKRFSCRTICKQSRGAGAIHCDMRLEQKLMRHAEAEFFFTLFLRSFVTRIFSRYRWFSIFQRDGNVQWRWREGSEAFRGLW